MDIKNMYEELSKASVDKGSSIKLAALTGDEKYQFLLQKWHQKVT